MRILKFSESNVLRDVKGRFADKPESSTTERPKFAKLLEQIQQPDGGFTMHPVTGEQPTTGFALSIHKGHERVIPLKDLTPAALVQYVKDNMQLAAQEGNYVGAWHNPADGNVYLDISRVVQNRAEAEQLGRDHNQLAIFDLKQGQSISLQKAA